MPNINSPTPQGFLYTFAKNWASLISGGLSVPFRLGRPQVTILLDETECWPLRDKEETLRRFRILGRACRRG